jgi:hypothetical protein
VRDNNYVAGQFLWTGIDYLGEAGRWPNRGNGAGLLDICGFKKPLAWQRQSYWTDKPMVFICASRGSGGGRSDHTLPEESWNWPSDAELTIHCYSTCPTVVLTLNGNVIGTNEPAKAADGELTWQVPYRPGVLKAEGFKDGKSVAEFSLQTAGRASRIELLPDTTKLAADGRDVCLIEFRVVDGQGTIVPDAANEVAFEITGPGRLLTVENADLNGPVDYRTRAQKAFHGRGLAILQSTSESGQISVKAISRGLEPAAIELGSQ